MCACVVGGWGLVDLRQAEGVEVCLHLGRSPIDLIYRHGAWRSRAGRVTIIDKHGASIITRIISKASDFPFGERRGEAIPRQGLKGSLRDSLREALTNSFPGAFFFFSPAQ